MRRVRRRMRPIYKLVHDDASILDTHYAGQAMVSDVYLLYMHALYIILDFSLDFGAYE